MLISLAAALALALSALLGKVLLRYRICDAGLVTWGQGVAISIISAGACLVLRVPLPGAGWLPVITLTAVLAIATRLLNQALQEGDASTVVPLLGLKIPASGLMAWLVLGERISAAVWLAVICSAAAVALFGIGRQEVSQGGHGRHPAVAVVLSVITAVLFSGADIVARTSESVIDPLGLVLWSNVVWGPVSALMLTGSKFRKYKVKRLDIGLFTLGAVFVTGAMLGLYYAFQLADSVIMPNVIMGTRGLFALIAGYALNKVARVPLERQRGLVYIYRMLGTLLILAALAIVRKG